MKNFSTYRILERIHLEVPQENNLNYVIGSLLH